MPAMSNKSVTGKPTRLQVEWVSQAKKTTSVIFPLKKHMSGVFCLSHDTKWEQFEAFLARIIANSIQKFKTQSLAVTSQMTSQWRYADGSNDVTLTGAMTSHGPAVRCSTICMTSLRFITMQPCDTKYRCSDNNQVRSNYYMWQLKQSKASCEMNTVYSNHQNEIFQWEIHKGWSIKESTVLTRVE
jgi:hypothetical protein